MAGDHGMLEKRTMYEEATRVPLFIHVPWLSEGARRVDGSVGLVDLVPTLLDLVGDPIPSHIEGSSLQPVLQGKKALDDNDVFLQWNGYGDRNLGNPAINRMVSAPWRSVVTGRPLEAKPQPRRSVRAIRPERRPARDAQPLRRPHSPRPYPGHDRPHQNLDARAGRHYTPAIGVGGRLSRVQNHCALSTTFRKGRPSLKRTQFSRNTSVRRSSM